MTATAIAPPPEARQARTTSRTILLACGALAPLIYVGTDLVAASLYTGYSYRDQTVSELFAIGAPTASLVVRLFTASSALLLPFAVGVWLSARGSRALTVMAFMVVGNAIDSLVLWNVFPMHMRGVQATLTDTMHGLFAINPFVLASICLGIAAFRGRFRLYSIATLVILLVPAVSAFAYAPRVLANQPTPWLGIAERTAQYGHLLWQAVLAIVLWRRVGTTAAPDVPARV